MWIVGSCSIAFQSSLLGKCLGHLNCVRVRSWPEGQDVPQVPPSEPAGQLPPPAPAGSGDASDKNIPAPVEEEPVRGEQGERKRDLEVTPDMFIENPDVKRRREQELAYRTLKECVIEMKIASNTLKDVAQTVGNQQNVGKAIATSQESMDADMERLSQSISATGSGSGIQYYASQLGGFKAEVKGHFKDVKKHFDNMSWDWCQGAKAQLPMWQYIQYLWALGCEDWGVSWVEQEEHWEPGLDGLRTSEDEPILSIQEATATATAATRATFAGKGWAKFRCTGCSAPGKAPGNTSWSWDWNSHYAWSWDVSCSWR